MTYRTLPVPAFDEHTTMFVAGVITIGVEYRFLDEATILAFYGADARAKFDNVAPAGMGDVVEEDGLCLHVFGTDDGLKYLRFDCFDDAPHYHYLDPHAPRNVVIDTTRLPTGRCSTGRFARCAVGSPRCSGTLVRRNSRRESTRARSHASCQQ